MKKFIMKLWKTPMAVIFLVITIFYGFSALGKPTEINRFAVVTAIGIDEFADGENEFELSFLTFIPIAEQTFTETYKVITAKGRSFVEAIDYAGQYLGREIGLSHLRTVVLNEELFKYDVTKILDYLTREKEVPSSTKLLATNASAKDFLSAMQKLDMESSLKVSEMIDFNKRYVTATDASLEHFFKGYFSPTRTSIIPIFGLEQNEDKGISVSNTESQGGSGGAQGGSNGGQAGEGENITYNIVNGGDALIFKNGFLTKEISADDMKNINYFRGNFSTGALTIEDFKGEPFKNANLTFNIYDKKIKKKVVFENGIPVFYTDIKFTVVLNGVEEDNGMFDENVDLYLITNKAASAIEKKVKQNMADGLAVMRGEKADLADFYTKMYNTDKKAFKRFLDSLDDKDDYLSHVMFKTRVRVYSR